MSILSPEQQAAAREMNSFEVLHKLIRKVESLEDCLSVIELITPKLFEARCLNIRETIRDIAIAAEQIELAIWADNNLSWALADSIRLRTEMLWGEWHQATGEDCLRLVHERSIPIGRQLRAISYLCELLQVEVALDQRGPLLRSA